MTGRIRVHAHSYRSDEILMLMRVAERFNFKIDVFTHVLEGYKVASEMAAHGAAGSTFSDWWQYKLEAYDAIPHNAAVMHEHGVLTGINSDISSYQPFMIHQMAKPVRYGGVSKEDALRMLTLNPAKMMLHRRQGGGVWKSERRGDVVLLSASPFDSFVRVEKTIVDGILYFDLEREAETRKEYFHERPLPALPRTVLEGPVAAGRQRQRHHGSSQREKSPRPSAPGPGAGGGAPSSPSNGVVLMGGTIHPISGPPIPNGVLIMRGGVITAVGPASEVHHPGRRGAVRRHRKARISRADRSRQRPRALRVRRGRPGDRRERDGEVQPSGAGGRRGPPPWSSDRGGAHEWRHLRVGEPGGWRDLRDRRDDSAGGGHVGAQRDRARGGAAGGLPGRASPGGEEGGGTPPPSSRVPTWRSWSRSSVGPRSTTRGNRCARIPPSHFWPNVRGRATASFSRPCSRR